MAVTVKELFAQVKADRVADALLFFLLDCCFSAEDFENTFVEKFQAISRLREIIRENVRLFADAGCTSAPYTIFILSTPSGDYENQCKKELSAFLINDAEALKVIGKDFRVFDSEGEARITHYGVGDMPIDDIAGCTIARLSVDELGAELCAAKILAELLFWGALPEQREKNLQKLHERLSKPIDKKEPVDSKPLEELMREHEEKLLANMSEDEKAYHCAKKRFEEETKEIVRRYQNRIISDNHRLYINAIKKEYTNR